MLLHAIMWRGLRHSSNAVPSLQWNSFLKAELCRTRNVLPAFSSTNHFIFLNKKLVVLFFFCSFEKMGCTWQLNISNSNSKWNSVVQSANLFLYYLHLKTVQQMMRERGRCFFFFAHEDGSWLHATNNGKQLKQVKWTKYEGMLWGA